MNRLSISAIIPTYNRATLVLRSLDSVLRELEADDEAIVVDDGSTDDTAEVLKPYLGRIRYFRIENRGAGHARNFGVAQATKPLIAFQDSDDEWMPGKIAIQRNFMQARPDVLFCFSDIAVTFKDGSSQHNYLPKWHNDSRSWDEILGPGQLFSSLAPLPEHFSDFKFHVGDLAPMMLKSPCVPTNTAVIRRAEAGDALRFAEDLPLLEDCECFSRLSLKGKAAYLDCETAWQHDHKGARLTDGDLLSRAQSRIVILERVWGADAEFMKREGKLQREILQEHRLLEISELISLGRTREARTKIALLGNSPPLAVRILASLPGALSLNILKARRLAKSGFGALKAIRNQDR